MPYSKKPRQIKRPGAVKPEARPIRPKVPGTKDRPRRRRLTTDPKILRGRQRRT